MNKKTDPKEWAGDFKDFMESDEVKPPASIRNEIFNVVHRDLNPSLWLVLGKIAAIHAVVGSFSLLLCSQFGMGNGSAVMHMFMGYGATLCMLFCGALFLGLTTVVGGFLLSNSELVKIRKTAYMPLLLLGTSSLTLFFVFGAEIIFNLALAWLIGAVVAGALVTEASIRIRKVAARGRIGS